MRKISNPKFDLFKDNAGEWRWRLRAKNGRIVATSAEGYKNKKHAIRMINKLKNFSDAPIAEL